MKVKLPFGKKQVEITIPDENYMQTLMPNDLGEREKVSEEEEIARSLENPICSKGLRELVTPGQRVVIVTSDITRPMPSYRVLPQVLRELNEGGISDGNITIVFALGSHRAHTEEEKERLVGKEIYRRVLCIDAKDDFVHLGFTKNL